MMRILQFGTMSAVNETKLVVKVQNQKPIGLLDLTLSLTNLSLQYSRFLLKNNIDIDKNEDQLYVKELKNGSAIFELVSQNHQLISSPATDVLIPLAIAEFNSIAKFLEYLKDVYNFLLGKKTEKPEFFPEKKKDLEQLNDLVSITAKDPNSTISFSAVQNAQIINNYNITYQEANASQNVLKTLINKTVDIEPKIHKKQLLQWRQITFDSNGRNVDRAIIDTISPKPLSVVFYDETLKKQMISGSNQFNKPWQDLAYMVDVEVIMHHDKPKIYKIINWYPDEVFDLNLED